MTLPSVQGWPDAGWPDHGLADVAVIGGGLAGALLALELAALGLAVELIDGAGAGEPGADGWATAWSYGAIAPAAAAPWIALQRRHGDLGWRRRWFRPLGPGATLGGRLPLPCGRVDVAQWQRRLPHALQRLGVRQHQARVVCLQPPALADGPWQLPLVGPVPPLRARQVVLAAGAGCRSLWPQLPERLRLSWAGVLQLQPQPGGWPWAGPAAMRLPGRFSRLALEARAPQLQQEEWAVDPALLPWGDHWLAGQISLVRPALALGEPPPAALQEQRLRQVLAAWLPALAHWPARLRQVPVSFCSDGQPLVGPVPGAPPGLWVFAGFSAAFSSVPRLAPELALAVHTAHRLQPPAPPDLQRSGGWPQ